MAIDRRLLFNIDWGMMAATLLLLGIGIATILSATYSGRNSGLEVKQVYWILIGLVALLVCVSVDYRRLVDHAPLLYLASLAVLAYVLFLGPRIAGTRRWIVLGPVQLQPSEFVKLVAALFVAKIFAESKKDSLGIADILGPGAAVGALALLIAAEPDLGTAFTLVPLFVTGAVLAGLRMKAVLILLAAFLVVGGLGWQFALKDYQKSRIYTFLDPSLDPRGAGYQKIQSEIAVGSGGMVGKGYKKGTQAQLGYLPARHDFSSPIAEENGFVGGGGPRPLPVHPVAGHGHRTDGVGPRGGLPGRRRGDGVRLPGRIQCRHGRGARPRQGVAVAPHELRWVLHHFVVALGRPHSQCADGRFAN